MHEGQRWNKSGNEEENYSSRPDPRLYGYNVHFNILYDMGANLTLYYATDITQHIGDTKEELYERLLDQEQVKDNRYEQIMRQRLDNKIELLVDGKYRYRSVTKVSILGWDPNEIQF